MQRPGVDRAGDCLHVREPRVAQALPRELVEERLPLALVDGVRGTLSELRREQVREIPAIARDCGRSVGLGPASAPALDPTGRDALDPLVTERLEGAPLLGALGHRGLGLLARAEPSQDLAAILARLRPFRLARRRAATLAAIGGLAPAAALAEGGTTVVHVADVDPRGLRPDELRGAQFLARGAHDSPSLGLRVPSYLVGHALVGHAVGHKCTDVGGS